MGFLGRTWKRVPSPLYTRARPPVGGAWAATSRAGRVLEGASFGGSGGGEGARAGRGHVASAGSPRGSGGSMRCGASHSTSSADLRRGDRGRRRRGSARAGGCRLRGSGTGGRARGCARIPRLGPAPNPVLSRASVGTLAGCRSLLLLSVGLGSGRVGLGLRVSRCGCWWRMRARLMCCWLRGMRVRLRRCCVGLRGGCGRCGRSWMAWWWCCRLLGWCRLVRWLRWLAVRCWRCGGRCVLGSWWASSRRMVRGWCGGRMLWCGCVPGASIFLPDSLWFVAFVRCLALYWV